MAAGVGAGPPAGVQFVLPVTTVSSDGSTRTPPSPLTTQFHEAISSRVGTLEHDGSLMEGCIWYATQAKPAIGEQESGPRAARRWCAPSRVTGQFRGYLACPVHPVFLRVKGEMSARAHSHPGMPAP